MLPARALSHSLPLTVRAPCFPASSSAHPHPPHSPHASPLPQIADDLRTYLHGHPGFNGTVVTGADVSPHTADWLSIAVLKGSQDKANETEIAARPEFSDWHVVSAALAAVSTDESR